MPENMLPEAATWTPGIYQIETDDPVVGGPEGISNRQAKELANRALWLKGEIEGNAAALAAHEAGNTHPLATTETKGMVLLATVAQAVAGLLNNVVVTPEGLAAAVQAGLDGLVGAAPGTLNTLDEIAAALGDDPNAVATIMAALAGKAPLNSPALTGTPTAPTPVAGDNSTKLANTAFVLQAIAAGAFSIPALANHVGEVAGTMRLAGWNGVDHVDFDVDQLFEGRVTVDQVARDQIALTNLRQIINTAVATSTLVQGKQWAFDSNEWGATSTNAAFVAGPPGYCRNVGSSGQLAAAATSISGGDDTSAGESQAQAYDGNLSTLWRSLQSGAGAYNTAYLGQDFGAGNLKNITQAYFNQGFSGNASHGATDIALQSADDIAGPWTTRASVSGQSQVQAWVTINSAYGGYHRYWRLTPTAGLVNTWRIQELQMTGVGQALDMTLIPPAPVTLAAAPSYGNLYFLWKDDSGAAAVPGADITAELSRDGGTTLAVAELTTLLASIDGTYAVIRARASLAGQPVGTSLTCRIKTLNLKAQRVAAPALYAE